MYKYKIRRHILCSEVYIKLYLDVVRCIFIIWLSAIKTQKNNAVFFYTWNMCVWWKGGVWTLEGGGQGGSFRKSYELSLKWVYHKFEHLPTSKPTLLKCHICNLFQLDNRKSVLTIDIFVFIQPEVIAQVITATWKDPQNLPKDAQKFPLSFL